MKAQFLKDDNGNIWFFYATNIQTRSRVKNIPTSIAEAAEGSKAKAGDIDDKEEMTEEIDQYKADQEGIQNKCIERMMGIMDGYYSTMKADMGIAEQQKMLLAEQNGSNDDALKLDDVLTKLRPNTTAKNFKEFLLRADNVNKSSNWRRISRKVNPTLDGKEVVSPGRDGSPNRRLSTAGSNQFITGNNRGVIEALKSHALQQVDPRQHRLRIQNLLSSYDKTKGPLPFDSQQDNRRQTLTAQKTPAIFTEGSAQVNQQMLSPQKTMFFGGSMPSSESRRVSVTGDRKHRTYLKAELVRKELLSRSDLIKLYQPPIPKSQLPTSNPFYTKTIVSSASPYIDASTALGSNTGGDRLMSANAFSPNPRQKQASMDANSQIGASPFTNIHPQIWTSQGNKRNSLQMSARAGQQAPRLQTAGHKEARRE